MASIRPTSRLSKRATRARGVPAKRPTMSASRYLNESLQTGLSVMVAVAESRNGLSVRGVASQLGMDYSKAYRLSSTLLELGYLWRDPITKVFRPGPAVLRLGYAYVHGVDVHQAAAPEMSRLATATSESVHLSALDADAMVLLDAMQPDHVLTTRVRIGSRYPLHCSASGQVALASLPADSLSTFLARLTLTKFTRNTITSRAELEKAVKKVRLQGFAVNVEEHIVGVQSAAAPICDRRGEVVAVLDVAVPSARITAARSIDDMREAVCAAAARISASMGASAGSDDQ